jgi:hypothetical protein
MSQQYRTEKEARDLVDRRFEEREEEISDNLRDKVKKKLDDWVTDDTITGLTHVDEDEALNEIDDFFDEAVEYVTDKEDDF